MAFCLNKVKFLVILVKTIYLSQLFFFIMMLLIMNIKYIEVQGLTFYLNFK